MKKTRTPKSSKRRRNLSSLEKLPTELLENVFLYCLNLDLPRSSPVIAVKLSSEPIYTRTIMAAFDHTWENCYDDELAIKYELDQSNAALQASPA